MTNYFWSPADTAKLRDIYKHYTCAELAKKFNRTPDAVKSKCSKLGLAKRRRWTDEDDDVLFKNAHLPASELALKLGRSTRAVELRRWRKRKASVQIDDISQNNEVE